MADFRTFKHAKRAPAKAMSPVIDPAGWAPHSLGDVENWSYHITASDANALVDAANEVRRNGIAVEDVSKTNFLLQGSFRGVLTDVREELRNGRGVVRLRNFPIHELDREGQAIAYLGLGSFLGKPMSQNMK